MLDMNRTISENLKNPMLKEFMETQGFEINENSKIMKLLTLRDVLGLRNIEEESFEKEYCAYIAGENQIHHTVENKDYLLYGRIPCVVQLPVQEMLDKTGKGTEDYNIALAEFGKEWLEEAFSIKKPSILMGTGIEGMVIRKELMNGEYSIEAEKMPYHRDFSGMEDPKGKFYILTAIPLVMVIDERMSDGRKIPHTMEELLEESYRDSIVYPDDGHMLDSIMLTYFYEKNGYEGVRRFRENTITGVHPSQMIKPGGLEQKPFIMLMPWIFAQIKAKENGMKLIWPEDGAPILPLVITRKEKLSQRENDLFETVTGREMGKIFRIQGFFPSNCAGVENNLPGKLAFVGWDFIYRDDLGDIIKECKKIMKG